MISLEYFLIANSLIHKGHGLISFTKFTRHLTQASFTAKLITVMIPWQNLRTLLLLISSQNFDDRFARYVLLNNRYQTTATDPLMQNF